MANLHRSSGSYSGSVNNLVKDSRSSIDSERSVDVDVSPPHTNGVHEQSNGVVDHVEDSSDPIERLQRELDRTKEEKEKLATQYRNLLAKLTQMRTTLGNKLQQDAEELDRREQLVQQLTAEKEDLTATVETLKQELLVSHEEVERASSKLDAMRTRVLQENAQESIQREKELRDTQLELEQCRMERDEWERSALQAQAISEDARSTVEALRRELELETAARARDMAELEREREKADNLQSVLQDFQSVKDHELREAVKDYESQLLQTTQSLAEFKHRALNAELQLEESHANITRTQELEKEVKEKKLQIDKLRHEAVIINEHLMEALRRLRRNSTEMNVDRRLVTNVLLSFLSTPRADSKRFEMLSLLASILSWNDQEREKAGLQRIHPSEGSQPSSFWGRSSNVTSPSRANPELEKSDETESFSRLWVEFLLTEAAAGESPTQPTPSQPRSSMTSIPASPPGYPHPGPPRRLSSLSSAGAASSPNLLGPLPSRKGKEKERVASES
ncbi:GRIP domain-containing protein [Psilocybe cubensis]|uniref:GRIP domain-containing protein n=2 Tax=Psilocybe cubensis TaxID=181762 RepID=A0ACB8GS03_PSICU|nr:GRIP domain-containing protein [Psilocybe cubensis]KAH9478418.1 GRIP domain-containing protein [Psilocybe cubensis]